MPKTVNPDPDWTDTLEMPLPHETMDSADVAVPDTRLLANDKWLKKEFGARLDALERAVWPTSIQAELTASETDPATHIWRFEYSLSTNRGSISTATLDFGDGSPVVTLSNPGTPGFVTHDYPDAGASYTAVLSVQTSEGASQRVERVVAVRGVTEPTPTEPAPTEPTLAVGRILANKAPDDGAIRGFLQVAPFNTSVLSQPGNEAEALRRLATNPNVADLVSDAAAQANPQDALAASISAHAAAITYPMVYYPNGEALLPSAGYGDIRLAWEGEAASIEIEGFTAKADGTDNALVRVHWLDSIDQVVTGDAARDTQIISTTVLPAGTSPTTLSGTLSNSGTQYSLNFAGTLKENLVVPVGKRGVLLRCSGWFQSGNVIRPGLALTRASVQEQR